MALIKAILSIEKPWSINIPNKAVPKAVENTIKEVVKALILPINFTPYISAQVDEPRTLAKPLVIPIKPKNIKALNSFSNKISVIIESNKGIFTIGINFLLVNLSTKKPDNNNENIDIIE